MSSQCPCLGFAYGFTVDLRSSVRIFAGRIINLMWFLGRLKVLENVIWHIKELITTRVVIVTSISSLHLLELSNKIFISPSRTSKAPSHTLFETHRESEARCYHYLHSAVSETEAQGV